MCEFIEGASTGQDSPQIGVIVFDLSFLPSGIGVAIEHPGPEFSCDRAGFNRGRVAEFRSIVGQDEREHLSEYVQAQFLLKSVEILDDGLGVVCVPQPSKHHAAIQLDRQQDFPSDAADDGIHLHRGEGSDVPDNTFCNRSEFVHSGISDRSCA